MVYKLMKLIWKFFKKKQKPFSPNLMNLIRLIASEGISVSFQRVTWKMFLRSIIHFYILYLNPWLCIPKHLNIELLHQSGQKQRALRLASNSTNVHYQEAKSTKYLFDNLKLQVILYLFTFHSNTKKYKSKMQYFQEVILIFSYYN